MTEASPAPPGPTIFYRLVIPLMIAEIVAALELTMIYAAMRSLVADFGGTSAAGWLVTSFMLSSAAGAALFGRLGDLMGRRRILLWVLALSTTGSLISSLTGDLGWLITGRAMQGLAGAIIPLCFGLIRERVAAERVPLGISLISSSASIAAASGLVIGGLIIDYSDWSMIFKVSAAMGAIAFLVVTFCVAADERSDLGGVRDDLLGGLLFIPAALGLLLAIDNAGHAGFTDRMTLVYGVISAVSLVAWIGRERSVANPLINVRLLGEPRIAWANILMVTIALGVFQGGQIMALFGQQSPETGVGLGLSATLAGFLLLPANILTGLIYPLVARANQHFGPRPVATTGCLMVVAAFLALIVWHDDIVTVMLLLVVQSIGLGIVYVTVPIVIVGAAPMDRVSEVTGMMGVIRATAMAIGAQTVATLLSTGGGHHGSPTGAFPSEAAYEGVFLFVAATALIGALVAQKLPGRLTGRPG
ncbi:MFS transporter [Sphingopyxis sp. PET50]|uniref:MFS transporter n=1 Tax=Sphingopyxis sp. PET50 TaxID=2976533 RepID=UPI0021AF65D6|nr:MFS transporter [Sphingopyxis sp. PET50]